MEVAAKRSMYQSYYQNDGIYRSYRYGTRLFVILFVALISALYAQESDGIVVLYLIIITTICNSSNNNNM